MSLSILHEDGVSVIDIDAATVAEVVSAIGWELKAEGLCRESECVPVRDYAALTVDGRPSLAAIASTLNRALVVDGDAQVAAISSDRGVIQHNTKNRLAADFTLSSLDGTPFTLSSIGRKKKLLVAWASW